MEAMKRKKIYTATDKIAADMLVEALKNQGIQAYRQGVGSGGYMDIYAGNSMFGEDIYVDEQEEQAAMEVIESMTAGNDDTELPAEDEIVPSDQGHSQKKMGQVIGMVFVLVLIVLLLFSGSTIF